MKDPYTILIKNADAMGSRASLWIAEKISGEMLYHWTPIPLESMECGFRVWGLECRV